MRPRLAKLVLAGLSKNIPAFATLFEASMRDSGNDLGNVQQSDATRKLSSIVIVEITSVALVVQCEFAENPLDTSHD